MGLLDQMKRATRFGYDGAVDSGRRKSPARAASMPAEDQVLGRAQRKNVQATARDVQRNFALASWAIRKHLDFISSFSFQAKTGDEVLDDELESFIETWSNRGNCDASKRHRLDRFVRLLEARRVVDGDVFVIKLRNGTLQAVESDRVRTPSKAEARRAGVEIENFDAFIHGVEVDGRGATRRLAVWNRDGSAYAFDRFIGSRFVSHYGFFDRFDQVRGISPMAAALNSLQDVYENIDYSLAKAKVGQLFALAFYRDAAGPLDGTTAGADLDGDGIADSAYSFDPTAGPAMLDLDAGDKAEILESKTPAAEFREFMVEVSQLALSALSIPYSFYDASHTNFYGSKGGINQYLKSCKAWRADCRELLTDLTRWRIGVAVARGEIVLPRSIEPEALRFDWIADGLPWLNPLQEVNGFRSAVESGFDSPQRICQQSGTNYYDNVDRIAEAIQYAKERGVPLSFAMMPELPDYQVNE